MTPTNRIARFVHPIDQSPAVEPESRWQPAAEYSCSEEDPASEAREPLCDDDALMVYHIVRDVKEGLEECVGDVLEVHCPSFEEIQRRGLGEVDVEITVGVKNYLSGLTIDAPPALIADYLRDQALLLIKAADRLEAEFPDLPKQ